MDKNLNLSPPWITFYKQMQALFEEDPQVRVSYDDSKKTIYVYVDNPKKAEALDMLLPTAKTFGNVTVCVDIIPANENVKEDWSGIILRAFDGNPAIGYVEQIASPDGTPFTYVAFKKAVVQYINDNTTHPYGKTTTLYQDIAREIFDDVPAGIFFCTE